MKLFKWHPDENLGFTGHVEVEIQPYLERMELAKDLQSRLGDDNEAYGREIARLALERIKGVCLTHTETGTSYNEVEPLLYIFEGAQVINEIGLSLIKGVSLGNLKGLCDSKPLLVTGKSVGKTKAT